MGETVAEGGGVMSSGPSRIAEAIVAALLPPACREEVLGDLHERYSSSGQYVRDALGTVPLVIFSRIRRTTDPQVLLMQCFASYVSFLGAARLNGGVLPSEQGRLLRLAIPAAMVVAGIMLEDTYARRGRRRLWSLARGPALGLGLAFASQGVLRIIDPNLAIPNWVMLYGCGMSFLLSSAIRMLFPPDIKRLQSD
jgi:hypothetical protein